VENPYKAYPVRIDDIQVATADKTLRTFKFVFLNPEDEEKFSYHVGQFAELSIPGLGEIPIGIASSPSEKGFVMFTVFRTGKVTDHLHNMKVGDIMGLRGPLGNWYPMEDLEGKNIVIIGAGFAFTTLRATIKYMLEPENRKRFGRLDVIYGARNPGMILYKDELVEWEKRDDINLNLTVDGTDGADWKYHTGFVPTITESQAPQGDDDTYAILCGPPMMLKFTKPVLDKLGYKSDHIFMSLENRMKCGIGMCGRCNIGKELVCKDGPVFTLDKLNEMPEEDQ